MLNEPAIICPKCKATSGDSWTQCEGSCPMPMSPHHKPGNYCVMRGTLVACHEITGRPMVWDTYLGALRFSQMNGGIVTSATVLTDASGMMPIHGPLQHSPDETQPLEG